MGAECARGSTAARGRERAVDPSARADAVLDEQAERHEHEEHEEDVQQRGARVDDVLAVDRQQQRRDRPQPHGAEHAPGDDAHDEDRQHADERGREPPAEAVVLAEELDAPPDQPLAQGRVDDEVAGLQHPGRVARLEGGVGVLRPLALVTELRERPALLHVVRLVEDQGVRSAQAEEAHEPAECRDECGDQETEHGRREAPHCGHCGPRGRGIGRGPAARGVSGGHSGKCNGTVTCARCPANSARSSVMTIDSRNGGVVKGAAMSGSGQGGYGTGSGSSADYGYGSDPFGAAPASIPSTAGPYAGAPQAPFGSSPAHGSGPSYGSVPSYGSAPSYGAVQSYGPSYGPSPDGYGQPVPYTQTDPYAQPNAYGQPKIGRAHV